jgi:hypothetical protein
MPIPSWVHQRELRLRQICEQETRQRWADWTAAGLTEQEQAARRDPRLGAPLVFADALAGRPGYVDRLLRDAATRLGSLGRGGPVDGTRVRGPAEDGEQKRRREHAPGVLQQWSKTHGAAAAVIAHGHRYRMDGALKGLDQSDIPVPKRWREQGFPPCWAEFDKTQRQRAYKLFSDLRRQFP